MHPLISQCQCGHDEHKDDPPPFVIPTEPDNINDNVFEKYSLKPFCVDVVVYHFPCLDGFASATVAYSYIPQAKFIGVNHGQLAELGPQLKGKRVLFLDIMPKSGNLQEWELNDYLVLDHHESSFRETCTEKAYLNREYSGCTLAWAYFYPGKRVPYIMTAIQNRDIWKHSVDDDYFVTGLQKTYSYCALCWFPIFFDGNTDAVKKLGKPHVDERMAKIGEFIAGAKVVDILGHKAFIIECDDVQCINDIGSQITKENTNIAIIWRKRNDNYVYSLRSQMGIGPDVSKIAQTYGGGGHYHASGFYSDKEIKFK